MYAEQQRLFCVGYESFEVQDGGSLRMEEKHAIP
jgi:hypothetical protein